VTEDDDDMNDLPDRIAEEVLAMSDEEIDEYIKEHGLEELAKPERLEQILKDAEVASRKFLN
jgi:hypothetical protein